MKLSNLSLLITANLLAPITTYANDAQSENDLNSDQSNEIEHVIVTGKSIEEDVSLSLKTPELLINVPQSLTVISAEQIEDQGFRDIGDILRYTPGASIGQGEGQRDQLTIRGQNTQANFFLDGLRDDAEYFRPFYNLERVEVLRGANALIFGRGGGGGVINRVTKKPVHDEKFGGLSASVNSFGSNFVTIDSNYSTSENSGFRINGFYESLENHRDFFGGDRFAFNPTFSADINDDTSVLVSYEHVNDDRTVDRGVPALNGRPLAGFRDTFFGDPNLNLTTLGANIFKTRVDHDISSQWHVDATLLYADYNKIYQNLFPVGFDDVAGTVTLDGYRDRRDRENLITQVNVVGEFDTGSIAHTLLFGMEYGDQDTTNIRQDTLFALNGDDQITFAFSDPLVIPAVSFPVANRDRDTTVQFQSFFIQDQIDIGEHFKVIGGARYDRFDIDVINRDGVADGDDVLLLGRVDEEISPNIGVIYKPQENMSLYASYSQTFLPRSGDQFLTLTLDQQALAPEVFTNMEIGFKWDISNAFSLTTSIFELERDSGTTVDPDNVENTILISSETRGIEVQLIGDITEDWSINVGYSNLNAEEVGRVIGGQADNRTLSQVPENMFSLWSRYDLNQQLGFGAGLIYQSGQFASISNAVELPSFTRVDAALFYALDKNTDIQLNIENLFDREYFPAAHNDNNISTGAPINARLTVRRRF
ncbi:MAG: TonB-dependent siderophore receptor [Gammaproteobacteria bacterium]|nr:TonB-dependent siderophore receptor [Gammaproteobacteria bacterium]